MQLVNFFEIDKATPLSETRIYKFRRHYFSLPILVFRGKFNAAGVTWSWPGWGIRSHERDLARDFTEVGSKGGDIYLVANALLNGGRRGGTKEDGGRFPRG